MRFALVLFFIFFICFVSVNWAQSNVVHTEASHDFLIKKNRHDRLTTAVQVDSILILGNRRTKNKIITRELTFRTGDTLSLISLSQVLEQNRLRLMNTNLFLSAKLNVKKWSEDNHVTVQIELIENWFLYPVPIFEIADRNFNVWWKEQKRDLKRTNYGMRFSFLNATGLRDPLTALVQLGYTPKYSLSYSMPYINKKQNLGVSISYYNAVNREVGLYTTKDKIFFYRDSANSILSKRQTYSATVNYTPGLYDNHNFSLGYNYNHITPSVAELNRNYFLEGKTDQRYFWISYSFSCDKRDIRPYPLNGYYLSLHVTKNGLLKEDDLKTFDISLRYAKYFTLTDKLSLESIWKGKTALMRQQLPYNASRGLGFGSDFIRGYEYYVTEGLDYTYLKNSLRFEVFNKEIPIKFIQKHKLLKNWSPLPLKCYLTANFDAGYVNNPYALPENSLANRALYGGGVGLDVIAYYNMVWRFEYSVNHFGERGFYFSYLFGF